MESFFRVTVILLYILLYFHIEGVTITKGPFLQLPQEDSVLVVWEQDEDSSPSVFCGVTENSLKEYKSITNGKRHEVILSNLSVDTEYYYYISLNTEKLSKIYSFRTIPEKTISYNFAVMGDTRSDPAAHSNIVNRLITEDIRFVVNTGDLVADGEEYQQWTDFFNIEKELLAKVPLFPVIGNHEVYDDKVDLYLKNFVNPVKSSGKEEYYSVDYANIHLTILDGHAQVDKWYSCSLRGLLTDDCFNEKQEKWLKEDLQKASANPEIDHILVFVHAGPFTSKEDRTGNLHIRNLLDFFKQNKVKAIISGHDHYYERGESGNGIPYIVSGGGGAPLYEIEKPNSAPHTVFYNLKDYHYLLISVAGEYLRIDSKLLNGEIFDIMETGEKPECIENSECTGENMPCKLKKQECVDFKCIYECEESEKKDDDILPDTADNDISSDNDDTQNDAPDPDNISDITLDSDSHPAPENKAETSSSDGACSITVF